MLELWMNKRILQEFLDSYYLQKPFALPRSAQAVTPFANWDVFGQVISQIPAPDMLAVRDGQLLPGSGPQSRAQLDALLGTGASLVVRKAERHSEALRAIAAGFAADLQGAATIQLFATPAGHFSFGWHYYRPA